MSFYLDLVLLIVDLPVLFALIIVAACILQGFDVLLANFSLLSCPFTTSSSRDNPQAKSIKMTDDEFKTLNISPEGGKAPPFGRNETSILPTKRSLSVLHSSSLTTLNPWFITGFSDAECSFIISIVKNNNYRTG